MYSPIPSPYLLLKTITLLFLSRLFCVWTHHTFTPTLPLHFAKKILSVVLEENKSKRKTHLLQFTCILKIGSTGCWVHHIFSIYTPYTLTKKIAWWSWGEEKNAFFNINLTYPFRGSPCFLHYKSITIF